MKFFIIGILFTLSIYHFIVYLGRRHDINILAFSLLCFTVSLQNFYEDIIPLFFQLGDEWHIISRVTSMVLYTITINFFAITIIKPVKLKFHIMLSVICNTILLLIGIAAILYYFSFRDSITPLWILGIFFGTYVGVFSVVSTVLIFKQKIYNPAFSQEA
jgi:hypothetical protein